MLKGINEANLLLRNAMIGMVCGVMVDVIFVGFFLASGLGMFIGAIGTYIYLANKYGRNNLNK